MPKRSSKSRETPAQYYDRRGVLKELEEGAVEFALEEELRAEILKGERKRRLEYLPNNVTVGSGVCQVEVCGIVGLVFAIALGYAAQSMLLEIRSHDPWCWSSPSHC